MLLNHAGSTPAASTMSDWEREMNDSLVGPMIGFPGLMISVIVGIIVGMFNGWWIGLIFGLILMGLVLFFIRAIGKQFKPNWYDSRAQEIEQLKAEIAELSLHKPPPQPIIYSDGTKFEDELQKRVIDLSGYIDKELKERGGEASFYRKSDGSKLCVLAGASGKLVNKLAEEYKNRGWDTHVYNDALSIKAK